MKENLQSVTKHITSIAQNFIYKYMKMNDIKTYQYSYHSFFHYMTTKLNILVMEHNLHNDIAGLSIIDKNGYSSISYQSDHHTYRQNFTKCHELGHFLLDHQGSIFTYSEENTPQEIEANIFAGQILAPDIVLYGKIVIEKRTFQDIIKDLGISSEALKIRLKQILTDKSNLSINEIESIILDYLTRKNNDLKDCLEQLSNHFIQDFKKVEIEPIEHIEYLLEHNEIVTSLQVTALGNNDFRNQLPPQYSIGWQFGRGVEFYYAWNNKNLSQEQAQKLGNDTWFRLAY
ncbi:TPA: ImmA/IrrE family metallo-endopeptidase [Streptococcus suis]|nr:ImmA/IrrE family metallo-endopeptidase [Streptococcus suis]NQR30176.1 ImmA/IrrE family metallo-endopeptidase [Streptococcus suis]NQR38347.1 ImmA/IrrE family metallo-endopeptidase [Streptococcus suis]HEM5649389.1 ImmA/IrrE family metallo-endopeptidase [Streptococcus suis]HEM5657556.1 ImmA/IrrE family metallo-endopeptidase [Streptococcus suis]